MQVAGYCTPNRKGGTIYQRVRRTAQSLLVKINTTLATLPPLIEVTGNYLINSSVPSQSTTNRTNLSDSSNTFATPPRIQNSNENRKRKRLQSKDKQHSDTVNICHQKNEVSAMKVATTRIATSRMLSKGYKKN